MFGWTKQAAVFSDVTLCDGMRYNSAKNMTYIPNEGVDMHRDADPGASKSSNSNNMDIVIKILSSPEGRLADPDHHYHFLPPKNREANICREVSGM